MNTEILIALIQAAYAHMKSHTGHRDKYSTSEFREMFCQLHVGLPRQFGATKAAKALREREGTLIIVADEWLAKDYRPQFESLAGARVLTAEQLAGRTLGLPGALSSQHYDMVIYDMGGMSFRTYCEVAEAINRSIGPRTVLQVTLGQPTGK